MKKLSALFLVLSLIISGSAQAKVVVGEAAPDFSAKDINGTDVKLSALSDKIVVLEWNNFECPFVKKQYDSESMQKLQKTYTDKGIVWLTINSSAKGKQGNLSDEEAKKLFAEKSLASSNYIRDEDGSIGKLYGASTTPHMFIINRGKLVYQGAIDSIPSADTADLAKAENYVSKAMEEIIAGKEVSKAVTAQYGCGVKYGEQK